MSESDAIDYDSVSLVDARSMYASSTMSLAVIGINLFMALYGLAVFLETRPDLRKGRRRYIVLSFAITILVAFNGSLNAFWAFRLLFESTSASDYPNVMEKYALDWVRWASWCSSTAMVFIGDTLLVYRCYIIWKAQSYVSILPALTCIVALALDVVIYIKLPDPTFYLPTYESARTALTVFTNLFVTVMIIGYLLRARRSLCNFLPSKDLQLYTGVLAVLVESAAPLSLFGLGYAINMAYFPKKTTKDLEVNLALSNIFSFLFYAFTSLSPHMIIFRVSVGRSWVQFPKSNGERGLSNQINFAAGHGSTYSSIIDSALRRGMGRISDTIEELPAHNV